MNNKTSHHPKKKFSREEESLRLKSLKKDFGKKKKLPRGYGLQALLALSQYPALKDIAIEFVYQETDSTACCRPVFQTMHLSARERTYRVIISKKIRRSKEPVRFNNLDFNIQVGILGHELAHVTCFLEKSAFEMAELGIRYITDNAFKRSIEVDTDMLAIKHGFGHQLLEYALIIEDLQQRFPEDEYYKSYFDFYMTAAEIVEAIQGLYDGI
jgi:hypothetical protein